MDARLWAGQELFRARSCCSKGSLSLNCGVSCTGVIHPLRSSRKTAERLPLAVAVVKALGQNRRKGGKIRETQQCSGYRGLGHICSHCYLSPDRTPLLREPLHAPLQTSKRQLCSSTFRLAVLHLHRHDTCLCRTDPNRACRILFPQPGQTRGQHPNPEGQGRAALSSVSTHLAHAPHDTELLRVDETLQHHPDGHVDIILHHIISQVHTGMSLSHPDHGLNVPHCDGDAASCLRRERKEKPLSEG